MVISQDPINLIICGVGGQGNILIAGILASALNRKNYHVTVGDTFGAAQRGGAVFSSMRISSRNPHGPLIPQGKAHLVLGLEPLETLRLLRQYGNSETLCITNIYPVYPVGVMALNLKYPEMEELKKTISNLTKSAWFLDATKMARELKAPITINVIMMGALIGLDKLPVKKKDIEEELKMTFPEKRLPMNLSAFNMGYKAMCSQS